VNTGVEVLWVDTGIVAIPLLKIDVPSSSKCVRFGAEFSRMEMNYKVETGDIRTNIACQCG